MTGKRVLVCGSRDFGDKELLTDVLAALVPVGSTVIDGACPYGGADQLAHDWAASWEDMVKTERYPAATDTAQDFHARNRAMVDSSPDLVVAFVNKPLSESRGTKYTVDYARSKGITTVVVDAPVDPNPPDLFGI